jgi:CPA1 family monovalent cation:H+ antiporter
VSLGLFDTIAVLTVLAAAFGLLNHHVLRLPLTIGLMLSALVASLGVLALDALVPALGIAGTVRSMIAEVDFTEALMHGMLGFLLFAGALHVDLESLMRRLGPILTLASVGLLISTAIVAVGSHLVFDALGIPVPFMYCLVFGALISPTDPVAVLGIMTSAGAPESLEIKVAGESLLNDGFAVVLFSILLAAAATSGHGTDGGHGVDLAHVGVVFLEEVVGGLALGLLAGGLVYLAMRSLHEPNLEVLLSVALVMGITFVAFRVHASAPLACVSAGLLIGNHGRRLAMNAPTREALDHVWSFVDEALNAVLFVLLGFEVLAVRLGLPFVEAAGLVFVVTLIARFISVGIPVAALRSWHAFPPGTVRVLTWGALKGGISVALALSLPSFEGREAVLTATYGVVVCSILLQGLTISPLVRRIAPGRS